MNEPTRKRLSMNTILMNARIFDEELSDDTPIVDTKPEIEFDAVKHVKIEIAEVEHAKIEYEEAENVKLEFDNKESNNMTHKKRKQVTYDANIKVKDEPIAMDEDTVFPSNVFDQLNLRNEEMTPVKLEVEENTTSSVDSNSRKSAKRTVFPRESPYKTRQSPYKRNSTENTQGTSFYHKNEANNGSKEKKQRKSGELESDPVVLQRRQKQIDYGKNTIGYDVYTNTVPRNKRKEGDPQTPNKYVKYSRRGFDGLIKQWRLKLHKYDPPQDE